MEKIYIESFELRYQPENTFEAFLTQQCKLEYHVHTMGISWFVACNAIINLICIS